MTPDQLQLDTAFRSLPFWRKMFKNKSEMDSSPMKFPISGFVPEGITFIGGLSESGKSWFGLSMAKAICTGEDFLGHFPVNEQSNVIYLVPESGERSFRMRMELMGIPDDDRFLCRTMADQPIGLDSIELLFAVRELKPVVFIDTIVRFSESENENDASQNSRDLAENIFALLKEGAKAVVCVHHSPKGSSNKAPTLENTLRGTGDLGAMADAVYSLKVEDPTSLRVRVQSVKARDFEPVPPFVIQGRPFIDEKGDFGLTTNIAEPRFRTQSRENEERFLSAIAQNPAATYSQLEQVLQLPRANIQRLADRLGWKKKNGTPWVNNRTGPQCAPMAA